MIPCPFFVCAREVVKMKRKILTAVWLVSLILLVASCGNQGKPGGAEKPVETVSTQARQLPINQWVDVSFHTTTYNAQDIMKVESTGTGTGHYLVEGWETRKELSAMDKAREGMVYLIILMRVRGNSGNPQKRGPLGPLVHPAYFDESGTNPSPRLLLLDSGGNQYEQRTSDSMSAAHATSRESLVSIEFSDPSEQSTAVAFQVPEGAQGFRLRIQVWEDKNWSDVGEWLLSG